MGTMVEAMAQDPSCALWPANDGDSADPTALAGALVLALDEALQVACRLRDTLGTITRCLAEAASPPGVETVLAGGRPQLAGLSSREVGVLRLLAAGHSNRRIAQVLYLSPRTVQRHVANVYLKIGAHCRAEATAYALRHGLV